MKHIKMLIYLLIQFHWRELLIMEVLFAGSVGLLTFSWFDFIGTIIGVFIGNIISQNDRHKKGII